MNISNSLKKKSDRNDSSRNSQKILNKEKYDKNSVKPELYNSFNYSSIKFSFFLYTFLSLILKILSLSVEKTNSLKNTKETKILYSSNNSNLLNMSLKNNIDYKKFIKTNPKKNLNFQEEKINESRIRNDSNNNSKKKSWEKDNCIELNSKIHPTKNYIFSREFQNMQREIIELINNPIMIDQCVYLNDHMIEEYSKIEKQIFSIEILINSLCTDLIKLKENLISNLVIRKDFFDNEKKSNEKLFSMLEKKNENFNKDLENRIFFKIKIIFCF